MRLLVLFLFITTLSFTQDPQAHTVTLSYDPADFGKNGFVINNFTVVYQFKNCYSEVHFLMGIKKSSINSSQYYYEGKYYTAQDLGAEAFQNVYIEMGSDWDADFYNSSFKIGHVDIDNSIGNFAGCFGDTYNFPKALGLNHADLLPDIANLRVTNWQIARLETYSGNIERVLRERVKDEKYNGLITQADALFNSGDYDSAISKYREATYIKSEEYPNQKIEEAKKLKNQAENQAKINDLISQGDAHLSNEEYSQAISKYEQAQQLDPENTSIQSKVEEAKSKKAEAKEKEEEEKEEEQDEKNVDSSEVDDESSEVDNSSNSDEDEAESAYNEEWERQQRVQEHYQLRQEQTNQNMYAAGEMGASAMLIHLMIGKLIYGSMGNDNKNSRLIGDSYHMSVFGGYGISSRPIFNNSSYEVYDGYNYYYNEQTENVQTLTLDLNGGFEIWPLMGRNKGWGGFIQVGAGHGILFQNFSTNGQFGFKGYFGTDNFKLFGEYAAGYRWSRYDSWIDAYEFGEGGRSSYTFSRLSVGPRFTFDADLRGKTKCHWDIRPVFEYNSKEPRYYGNNPLVFNWNNGFHTSFWFENRMKMYFEYFWDYVRTGEVEYGFDEDATFSGAMIRMGFMRSLDIFGNTSFSYNKNQIKNLSKKKNKFTLYLGNPTINWIQSDKDTSTVNNQMVYMNDPSIGMNPIGIEQEINLFKWISVSAGGILKLNSGGRYNVAPGEVITVLGNTMVGSTRIRHQILAVEIPLTTRLYLNYNGINKYWVAGGMSKQVNIMSLNSTQDADGNYDTFEATNNTLNRMSNSRFLQVGMDYSTNGKQLLRIAAKLNQGTSSLFSDTEYVRTGSFAFQFGLIF